MERQAIERLAMDIALGELNGDAAALFDTYLTEHPEARPWAQPMKAICLRTQAAIHAKTLQLKAPARRATTYRFMPIGWARLGRWAAVVALSLVIGIGAGRWLKPDAPTPRATVAVETPHNFIQGDWRRVLSEPGRGFWESRAAATLRSEPGRSSGSQESQPSLWEMFRQRQREFKHV